MPGRVCMTYKFKKAYKLATTIINIAISYVCYGVIIRQEIPCYDLAGLGNYNYKAVDEGLV